MHILLIFALLAQSPALPATGRLVEKVACRSTPPRPTPCTCLAHIRRNANGRCSLCSIPRGRGTFAAEIFRDAAEKYGWIIASSDNTQSDGEWEPNQRALAAMWPDVLEAYAVDPRRVYAAGFSGGASVAWALGRATDAIAGVIASGAPNPGTESPKPVHFAWFGSAGRADFNFLDAKAIDRADRRRGQPASSRILRRLAPVAAARPGDARDRLARGIGDEERTAAARRGARRRRSSMPTWPPRARWTRPEIFPAPYRAYTSIVETYDSLADVAPARERLRALDADDAAKRARRDETRADERERDRKGEVGAALVRFMTGEIETLPELLGALAHQLAAESGAGHRATRRRRTARTLEQIFVQVSFYVWRDLEEKHGLPARRAVARRWPWRSIPSGRCCG